MRADFTIGIGETMKAAAYTRSSKDRSDISIATQNQALDVLASARDLQIVKRYEDAVQSGSTDVRPAFGELIADIKNPARGWSTLLVYDTSRIARGRYIAQAFKHECRRRGVELVIAKMPETDPVSTVILEAVLEAMDEVHSIMSREKGLAGMRENVRRGWRAGGRAPWGYRLAHEPTGAIREGKPVMKSKLDLAPEADRAGAYLRSRARGVSRFQARREHGVELSATTLIDIEWNALVYAGHTVWNRHTAKKSRGQGKSKKRDRSDWVINRDTHPAVISESEAESLLAQLQSSNIGQRVSEAKAARGTYLLSGKLQTSDGRLWVGAGIHYRLKGLEGGRGKRVQREEIERSVLAQVRQGLRGDLVDRIAEASRALAESSNAAAPIQAEIERLEKRKAKAAQLALEPFGADIYPKIIEDLSRQLDALRREAAALAKEDRAAEAIRTITPAAVREALFGLDSDRALITALVQRVVLEPDLTGRVEYGLCMASPKGFEPLLPP